MMASTDVVLFWALVSLRLAQDRSSRDGGRKEQLLSETQRVNRLLLPWAHRNPTCYLKSMRTVAAWLAVAALSTIACGRLVGLDAEPCGDPSRCGDRDCIGGDCNSPSPGGDAGPATSDPGPGDPTLAADGRADPGDDLSAGDRTTNNDDGAPRGDALLPGDPMPPGDERIGDSKECGPCAPCHECLGVNSSCTPFTGGSCQFNVLQPGSCDEGKCRLADGQICSQAADCTSGACEPCEGPNCDEKGRICCEESCGEACRFCSAWGTCNNRSNTIECGTNFCQAGVVTSFFCDGAGQCLQEECDCGFYNCQGDPGFASCAPACITKWDCDSTCGGGQCACNGNYDCCQMGTASCQTVAPTCP